MWHHLFLKSKTKEPPLMSDEDKNSGGIFISVYNFTAQ